MCAGALRADHPEGEGRAGRAPRARAVALLAHQPGPDLAGALPHKCSWLPHTPQTYKLLLEITFAAAPRAEHTCNNNLWHVMTQDVLVVAMLGLSVGLSTFQLWPGEAARQQQVGPSPGDAEGGDGQPAAA